MIRRLPLFPTLLVLVAVGIMLFLRTFAFNIVSSRISEKYKVKGN